MSVYHDLNSYIEAKEIYRTTPGKIVNGVGYYLSNGKWISDEEYKANNSKPRYSPAARANPDGQNIESETIIRRKGK